MDDLISRQEVIRWVKTECNPCGKPTLDFESGVKVMEHLKQMPSVDAQSLKRGHWEIYVISPFDGEDVRCSECGKGGCVPYWDYCPHCGARMDGLDEFLKNHKLSELSKLVQDAVERRKESTDG